MRKVTLGLATSLDNYIARADGGADWLLWTKEVADLSAKFMKTVDAILIGRKTYEVMLASGETSYPGATNYVFSRSQKKLAALAKTAASKKKPLRNVEFVAQGAVSFLKDLKQQKGSGIVVFGGGQLANSLFNADLIDEVVVNVHPVILGSGIPLFSEIERQINLELFEVKRLKNNCVMLSYRIQR
ncbi:MAG TPA: dihydrofolate reductase family protein [Pyrinomonadaceae bacterium]|nr:dihydrofolate reductase family protein [Pyrinomonadaceae bacterium]